MFGPMAYMAFLIFNKGKRNQKIYYLVSVILGIGIACIWYLPHIKGLFLNLGIAYGEIPTLYNDMPRRLTLGWFLFYPFSILAHGISFFYGVIFFLSISPFLKNRVNNNIYRWIIILWLLVPYLILTTANSKVVFYCLPTFLAIAMIISSSILTLKNSKMRKIFVSIIVIFSSIQFYAFHFGISAFPQSVVLHLESKSEGDASRGTLVLFDQPYHFRPHRENWKTKEILQYIDLVHQEECRSVEPYHIGVLPNCRYFSSEVFASHRAILDLFYMNVYHAGFSDIEPNYGVDIEDCSYAITKTGEQGCLLGYPFEKVNQVLTNFLQNSDLFTKLPKEFFLPDDSKAILYKKIYPSDRTDGLGNSER